MTQTKSRVVVKLKLCVQHSLVNLGPRQAMKRKAFLKIIMLSFNVFVSVIFNVFRIIIDQVLSSCLLFCKIVKKGDNGNIQEEKRYI